MGGDVTPEPTDPRRAKLARLRESGIDPYPARYERTCILAELRERHAGIAPGARTGEVVRVAGRIRAVRDHGGLVFCDLRDQSARVQLLVERGAPAFRDLLELDLGDWAGIEGEVVASRTGELSVQVGAVTLLSKTLRAIPRPRRGISDVEVRHRQRYLDLIVNDETRRIFDVRHAVVASIRRFLNERDYVEVETPVLEQNATGAAARPFDTYHNALDLDMVLRISLELPLKRLVVGGFERVFELGRTFRNEGLSPRHNPEFTMLELYEAFADCAAMMDLTEAMVAGAAQDALGTTVVDVDGRAVDLAPPWRRASMAELIAEHSGHEMHPSMPVEEARKIAAAVGVAPNPAWGAGALMAEVFEAVAEEQLVEPTMVCDYPREISPLAKSKPGDPGVVDRFELIVAGRELANAYSELNDPDEQRRRMEVQAEAKATGDEEASDVDEDYLRALEHGLPPCGGLGVGIDRLVMLIAGTPSIREVILFPTLRPLHRGIAQRRRARSRAGALPAAAELAAREPEEEPAPAEPARKMAALPHPRAPRVLAWLTALGGLLAYVPLLPVLSIGALSDDAVLEVDHRAAAAIGSIVLGLSLLAIARGLARRKRRAWQLAIALFPLCAVLLFLRLPDLVTPLFALGMVAALWRYRAAFTAPPDPRSSFTLVRFLLAYLALVGVYGTAVLVASAGDLKPGLTLGGILGTTYGGLLGFEGPYAYLNRFVHEFFEPSLLVLGVIGLAAALWLALRPRLARTGPSAEDRARARELVRRYGDDTLAYFALRDDKLYFFSSDGRAVIPYAFVGGHALVSGDPIGDPEAIPRAVEEFVTHCRERAWRFAFLAVREDALPMYRRLGMRGVYLGDEAVIACSEFTLHGRAMKSLRTTVQRVKRDHRFELIRESDAAPALVEKLNAMTRRWRGDAVERGFTMALGLDVEGDDPQFLLAIAYDRRDEPVAYLRLVPIYGDRAGYSLDLMRREPEAANGVTEFLIALAALRLGELGFWRLSMNFAPWGRLLDEDAELGAVERGMRTAAKALSPFFQVASLRTFSAKFAPDWLARSIVIEDPAQFARVGLLYAGAEGFLDVPVIGPVLTPRAYESKERH